MFRAAQTSSAAIPQTSRIVTTLRWRAGSADTARSSRRRTSLDSTTFSGRVSHRDGVWMDVHFQEFSPPGTPILTSAGPSSGASDQGSVLASRAPRVLARLTRIENVHVRSDDLPSNFARP